MPLPIWLAELRPPWLLIIMIYWLLRCPYHVGLGVVWLVGLFLDLLQGSLLGEHAYAFVFIGFLVSYFNVRIRQFPFRQQMLIILALLILYQVLLLIVQIFMHLSPDLWLYWLPAVAGTLLWPLVYGVMESIRRALNKDKNNL